MACATLKRSYHQMMDCSPSGSPKSTVDSSCLLQSTLGEQGVFGKRYCCGISSFSANLNESCSSAAAASSSPVWNNLSDVNIYSEESNVTNTEELSPALENVSPPKVNSHPLEPIEDQNRNPQKLSTISKAVSSRSSSALKTRFLEEVKRLERRGGLLSSKGSGMSNSHGASKVVSQSQPLLNEDAHLSSQAVQDCTISLSQAYQLCNRIWRDREAQLRQVYEEVLLERLTEQYELFAQRVEALINCRSASMPPPSYVS